MAGNEDDRPARRAMDAADRAVSAMLRPHAAATEAAGAPSEEEESVRAMGRLWDEMGGLKHSPGYAALLGTPTWRERIVELRERLAGSAWRFALPLVPAGAAAALALYVVAPHPAHYEAGGQAQRITLADRSSIVLGPSSRLDFEMAGGKRLASLTGEAQFSVAHDVAHPFLITVGDAQVRVVGTRFTLAYRNACTQLSVLSGTVVIRSPSMAPRRLNAGEETVNVDNGQSYRICLDHAQGAAALRWSYIDVPLSTVIDDVGRFYPRKIVIRSPDLARERVTMTFKVSEVENIINLIPEIADARVDYGRDGQVYIDRK